MASICININKNGMTNSNLVAKIFELLDDEISSDFKRKISLRGEDCNNNKYHFSIDPNLPVALYPFDKVPIPKTNEYIDRVSWNVHLDGIEHISSSSKEALISRIIEE